ncbi:kinase-like domain-containing protein [Paraphoma chrysanthemicola]|nr:kinase-like domain-containing protein [Paraphoma chrysanthemicola]
MAGRAIPYDVLEHHATRLIQQMRIEYQSKARCEEANFDRLASVLVEMGKVTWASRPRTYTVLHMIGRLDVMDSFVEQDLFDIHFPYTEQRLPRCLSKTADRLLFVELQNHVLTVAKDVEDFESKVHRNLKDSADEWFFFGGNLGRGGYGYVDRVRSRLSLNEFALKRSLRGKMFSRDQAAMRVFVDELNILKQLSHEHLVKYIGSYTDPKWVGILMLPVADCDLRIFLDQSEVLQQANLIRQFYGCLVAALLYLHQKRIRHKDLKPQNILVKNTQVLITDFGTALDWNDESRATTAGDPGPISINYAAPEVVDRERRSESSDIWSLGCIFVDMTTVLKGRTNEDRKSFFTSSFTGASNYCRNSEALSAWLLQLEQSPKDNVTISWIRCMVQHDRTKRIAASHLADEILNYQDEHVYLGPCCADQDDAGSTSNFDLYGPGQESGGAALSGTSVNSQSSTPQPIPITNLETIREVTVLSEEDTRHSPAITNDSAHATAPSAPTESHTASRNTQSTLDSQLRPGTDGNFNPNPPSSGAVQAVDELLGVRRVNSGLHESRPTQTSDRVDTLWQPAYLWAYSQSLRGQIGALTADATIVEEADQDRRPEPGAIMSDGMGINDGQNAGSPAQSEEHTAATTAQPQDIAAQLPSWDQFMIYTGISRMRGI